MRLRLLLPERKHLEAAPTASFWFARGDRHTASPPGRDAVLRDSFVVAGGPLPAAALTRSLDAGDAADALWLRADPAFVMADAVTLRLMACGRLGLSAGEVEAFAQTLVPLFRDFGLEFDAPHPDRWYLRCPRETTLPTFSPPEDALGDDLGRHLPEGGEARRWRSLLNEVQIVLTQHPVNASRAQRGLPPVNSLWFWAGGTLPESVRCEFSRVYSDDEIVAALAARAGVAEIGRAADAGPLFSLASTSVPERRRQTDGNIASLIDLARYRDSARLESEWLAPIDVALRKRTVVRLDLHWESGERSVVQPGHRWRFWRRTKPER